MDESNNIEKISLNENFQLLKNKRTDISLLELTQENISSHNKIFNTKKDKEQQIKENSFKNDNKKGKIYLDLNRDINENSFVDNNKINKNKEEDNNSGNQEPESYDDNLNNLHRIEKIENLINVINGNVNFINSELKSIKTSLMKKKRTNYIKQKLNRINQEVGINITEKDKEITSEDVLREIEKLKSGNKNLIKNENIDFYDNNSKENIKNRKNADDNPSLLQIKSFNDLNIDLDTLEGKNKNEANKKNNKDIKNMQDLKNIIEGFKNKQTSEELNLNKKKFHKQMTLNDKQEVSKYKT